VHEICGRADFTPYRSRNGITQAAEIDRDDQPGRKLVAKKLCTGFRGSRSPDGSAWDSTARCRNNVREVKFGEIGNRMALGARVTRPRLFGWSLRHVVALAAVDSRSACCAVSAFGSQIVSVRGHSPRSGDPAAGPVSSSWARRYWPASTGPRRASEVIRWRPLRQE